MIKIIDNIKVKKSAMGPTYSTPSIPNHIGNNKLEEYERVLDEPVKESYSVSFFSYW